ncbi:hypothetical protein IPM19_00050 [bacterium]|nr:MAG: hypothetical protein IPM19_00050 [bacterium]
MKAIKAGPVIGQALENYEGGFGQVGNVTFFVKAANYSGASISEELLAWCLITDTDQVQSAAQTSVQILEHLLSQLASLDENNISQIRTDIVIAGAEVVTQA